jgi:condensin complex subunit 3
MAPASDSLGSASPSVGRILNEAQINLSVHKKCVKLMVARRHRDPGSFLPELCNCILPVLLEYKVRRRRV